MNLYELSARYQQLLDQDEYTADDLQELADLGYTLEDEFIERAKYIRNMEAECKAILDAAHEMHCRASALDQKAFIQREKLLQRMQECQIERVSKSPLFELRVKQNPVSVDDFEPHLIPSEYRYFTEPKVIEKIDKTAIKQAIESGVDVPGARLIRKMKLEIK